VRRLMADERFVQVNQRRWADAFLYSTEVVSVQSIYDMDRLTAKLLRGLVPYDLFAAVASAHPVLTRRHADPRDTAEALFRTFLGRPPFENERADMARLYNVWQDGYYDHPYLNMRLPDAFLRFPCLDEDGNVDPELKGECTSVLWGYHELVFQPDLRATVDLRTSRPVTWAGLLRAAEWERAQVPGRILAGDLAFWEKAVGDVLVQYLGYDLAHQVPEVRQELVTYLLANQGDLRSVHFAVATSIAYLQSNEGASTASYRWTYGPLKQLDAEVWLDSLGLLAPRGGGTCDHRITSPESFMRAGSLSAYRVLDRSGWGFDEQGELDMRYADAARMLGGCPENVVGGRFKVVSILTTATQLEAVADACNPKLDAEVAGAAIERLLPAAMDARRAVGSQVARQIADHQYRTLLGRSATVEELADADAAGAECALTLCDAEEFARPFCFALLSSAERVFY
jgi:hypothetical protein